MIQCDYFYILYFVLIFIIVYIQVNLKKTVVIS